MKNFITKQGLEKLKRELNGLKGEKRIEIAKRIKDAKDMGDLSENAEYTEAKEAQSFNENKIAELEMIIKKTILIDESKNGGFVVQIGSKMAVKNSAGTRHFTIVGSSEADPANGKISNESPFGSAFLNHKVGDEVEVRTPGGVVKYKIVEIK